MSDVDALIQAVAAWRDARVAAIQSTTPDTFSKLADAETALCDALRDRRLGPPQRSWPRHAVSLHVTHNQHLAYYDPPDRYIAEFCDGLFIDETEKQRAIATNEIWEIQWYPDTPNSFYKVAASTFERALDAAHAVEEARLRKPTPES